MTLDLWPLFPAETIIFEDRDLIAVDKPANVPTHAPEHFDDIHRRLLAWLRHRSGKDEYLGIHQRLLRDASGVLVFTRRREANRAMAEQIERRRARATYIAVVHGMPGHRERGVLRHRLLSKGGTHQVLPSSTRPSAHSSARPGELSTISFRVLDKRGDRTLLELSPEPSCPIDLPAQLEAENAPIFGDIRNIRQESEKAHRLCLHLATLKLEHPSAEKPGRSLELSAPIPAFFFDVLEGRDPLSDVAILERRLREAASLRTHLAHLGSPAETNAFRIANALGDGLPGITVDRYGDFLVVSLYDERAEEARDRILDAAHHLGPTGIYVKSRPKNASRIVDARQKNLVPSHPVRGIAAPDPLIVLENGLPYEVRLGDGLSTGIFLDQRENRKRLAKLASGLDVANLFAYTCPFTVALAAGNAKKTVSADISRIALEWARKNLDRIGADPEKHVLVEADVLTWLDHAARRNERFDLVILDPPSFSTTKQSRFSAESDYKKLATLGIRILSEHGRLLACTNHKGIHRQKFRRILESAAAEAGRAISQMKDWPDPEDYPPEPSAEPHLKTVLVTLDVKKSPARPHRHTP